MEVAEEWRPVKAFPKYEVSPLGLIRHVESGRVLHPSLNQQGHPKVNLVLDGRPYTRHVNHVVARVYLEEPKRHDFISLIHLDGQKTNCAAANMQWRPRYFAVRYHNQFHTDLWQTSKVKIEDIKTGEIYKSIQDAVVKHGLLFSEVLVSLHDRTYVWPTYQEFRALSALGNM